MSIHSSLRSAGKGKKFRSVLKRYERLRVLKDRKLWSEERSALGIPKVKMQKIKIKKEKAATPADAAAGAPGATGTPAAAPAGVKPAAAGAAPAKEAAKPAAKPDKK